MNSSLLKSSFLRHISKFKYENINPYFRNIVFFWLNGIDWFGNSFHWKEVVIKYKLICHIVDWLKQLKSIYNYKTWNPLRQFSDVNLNEQLFNDLNFNWKRDNLISWLMNEILSILDKPYLEYIESQKRTIHFTYTSGWCFDSIWGWRTIFDLFNSHSPWEFSIWVIQKVC